MRQGFPPPPATAMRHRRRSSPNDPVLHIAPREPQSWFVWLLLTAVLAFASDLALATDDPPGRIGRLARLSGEAWLFDSESRAWVEAPLNQPLTSGDRLSIGKDARATVQIGSTTVRIDSASELEFARIDDERIDLRLHTGSFAAQISAPEVVNEIGLATAEAAFRPTRTGHYRIDRRDGTTQASVWNGELWAAGPGLDFSVRKGQRLEVWLQGEPTARYAWHFNEADGFSDWVARSQQEERRSVAQNYLSPEMTGWEDLDRHGRWEESSDYGPIWYPTVAVDWEPYRHGRWVWMARWGWTWVDAAPWGFAPFHYGRWVRIGGRWCWSPGQRVARPVYVPALVAWPGVSVGISVRIGNAPPPGWIPLSPYEPYRPWYRYSGDRYYTVINQTHVHIHRDRWRDHDHDRWREHDHDRGRDRDRHRERERPRPGRDNNPYDDVTQYRNAPIQQVVAPQPPRVDTPRSTPRPRGGEPEERIDRRRRIDDLERRANDPAPGAERPATIPSTSPDGERGPALRRRPEPGDNPGVERERGRRHDSDSLPAAPQPSRDPSPAPVIRMETPRPPPATIDQPRQERPSDPMPEPRERVRPTIIEEREMNTDWRERRNTPRAEVQRQESPREAPRFEAPRVELPRQEQPQQRYTAPIERPAERHVERHVERQERTSRQEAPAAAPRIAKPEPEPRGRRAEQNEDREPKKGRRDEDNR